MMNSAYPISPVSVPPGLTKVSVSYSLRAILAIFSIGLFFCLYTLLVLGLGLLLKFAFFYDIGPINKFTVFLKIGAIAGSAMLFIFTFKFIFKLKNPTIKNRIKLNQKEHPELTRFIQKICQETGAPKPKNIYVDPDVNAYVAYSNIWLSLFLPVRKDLTIGLGLIDTLNLSEFKAVMAHEFGHFAQSSMKIGSYIMSANTIIHGMIFDRDSWDELFDTWRRADLRLSIFAWIITPVIWLIRQTLNLFYILLNFMYSSLSREMEFNADKFAVSITGSEAIISGLWKLDFGSEAWNATLNHAYLASQKDIFAKNLYLHNRLILDRSASNQSVAFENLSTDLNGSRVFFQENKNSTVGMYASHPANDAREKNAKNPFVKCEEDARSPWILFSNAAQIQEEATLKIYQVYLQKKPQEFAPVATFEDFVHAENHGKELMEEYYNTFQDRFLYIPSSEELQEISSSGISPYNEKITLLKKDLVLLMKPVQELENLMKTAHQIADGTTKQKSLSYDNQVYDKKNIQQGYNLWVSKRENLFDTTFKEWDTLFCAIHLELAQASNKKETLLSIYHQHASLAAFFKLVSKTRNLIFTELNKLQEREEVSQGQINKFSTYIVQLVDTLEKKLNAFSDSDFIPLPNIATVEELKKALVDDGKFPKVGGSIFENGGFDKVANALESAMIHCQRIDQKSIAFILRFQEELKTP